MRLCLYIVLLLATTVLAYDYFETSCQYEGRNVQCASGAYCAVGEGSNGSEARKDAIKRIAEQVSSVFSSLDQSIYTQSESVSGNGRPVSSESVKKIKESVLKGSLDNVSLKTFEQKTIQNKVNVYAYVCKSDVARLYLDSLKNINQRVKTQKVNSGFCKTLYETYSPKVMLFERFLERQGETGEAVIADYRRVERECDNMSASMQKGYVGFEEALDKAVAEIVSKRGRAKTRIVIGKIYDSEGKFSEFITAELESKLVKVNTFEVTLANVNANTNLKMAGPMQDQEAMEIGKSAQANIVITGTFMPTTGFSYFKIRTIEVALPPKLFAMHTDKIRPDDMSFVNFMPVILPSITDDALAYFNKGMDFYMEMKLDAAINEFNRALAIDRNLAEVYFFRGNIYDYKGNYDKAIEDYSTVLRIKPDSYKSLYNRGNAYAKKGDNERAIEDWTAALRINPYFYDALNNRGNKFSDKGYYDWAIEDFNAAIRIKPDFYMALNNRGTVYYHKGYYDWAIQDYNYALGIKPDLPEALTNRGAAFVAKGYYDWAIQDYNAALRIKPGDRIALINRGIAYDDKGNYDRAIEDWTAALNIKLDDDKAFYSMGSNVFTSEDKILYSRGKAYLNKDNYDKAIEDFNAALRINPYDHLSLTNRGAAYAYKGYSDRAIEDWTAALSIKPDFYDALYSRGRIYYEKGNYDRAIEDFNVALRIKPNNINSLTMRGLAYYSKGYYDQAIEDWEIVLRIEPNNPAVKKGFEDARQKRGSKTSQGYTTSSSITSTVNSLQDPRDNKTYRTVKIGNQVWMAENLNYNANGSKCYDNNSANCDKYGRLYDWNTAMWACPSGWHLPSDDEWNVLMKSVNPACSSKDDCAKSIKLLKAKSGWNGNGNSPDAYGFAALPGGYNNSVVFSGVGIYGNWWSASEYNSGNAYDRGIRYDNDGVFRSAGEKKVLCSVRCIKD